MGARIALAALLLGCAASRPHEARISVRAETPSGEPLEQAIRRLDPGFRAPLGAVVTERPLPRVPAASVAGLPWSSRDVVVPCHVSLVLGERVFDSRVVTAGADIVFTVEPEEILRALPTVRVRLVARLEDVVAMGPDLASSATWHGPGDSRLIDVRSGSCEIPRAVPGEGWLVVSGPCAVAMMRIDVKGASDIDLELQLVRPAAVSGRVEVPVMTDPTCDVYALPLDGGVPPPPHGPAPRSITHGDGTFEFGSGPRGRQVLLAKKPGYGIGWAVVDNTTGPVKDVRIPLRPGVRVDLDTTVRGPEARYVQVETEEGVPLFGRLLVFEKRRPPMLTLAEGRYILRHRSLAGEWHARPLTVSNERLVVRVP